MHKPSPSVPRSPLKRVHAQHLGKEVAFGRRRPRVHAPKLQLRSFLDHATLPPIPATTNFRAKADRSLRDIYGNDQLGDCVPAGLAHVLGVLTANADGIYVEQLAQVIRDYEAIGGYNPNDPSTDQGCDEDTAMAYYQSHGFADGTKAAGSISVDATNQAEVRAAMFLFENLVFGVGLPDAWITPFPDADGFVWDVAGDSNDQNGHCYVAVDLATNGLVIDTWALEGVTTHAAIAKYASHAAGGQLFAILSPDQVAKAQQKAPNGVDWVGLIKAFNAMGGNVPIPVPPPAPPPAPPAPTPTGIVTLQQATGATDAAFHNLGRKVINRDQAAKVARDALTALWAKAKK